MVVLTAVSHNGLSRMGLSFKSLCPNASDQDFIRKALLELAEHTETDRWPSDHPDIDARDQPKDGATIFSTKSHVWASAVHLEHMNMNLIF